MLKRDGYPAGVPCWIDTSQPDPAAAIDFYRGLFGWEFEDVMPPGAPGQYFIARLHGGDVAAVGSMPKAGPPHAVWNTYVWVDSADETAAKVKAAGGTVITPPFDVTDAGRMAVFADPDGAVFCVWQANQHRGAQVVNEPGTLNFNGLNTRDVDAAQAFYGDVFGWTIAGLPGGFGTWRLAGYGDHLEELMPGTRERMAAVGAPEGFEDTVATVATTADGQPAHWSVTFAVADADATANRASELGAQVLSPPSDAPWVRMAVIQDPQGATFIASQFVPENKDLTPPQ